jgi:hypothetical protein
MLRQSDNFKYYLSCIILRNCLSGQTGHMGQLYYTLYGEISQQEYFYAISVNIKSAMNILVSTQILYVIW